MFQYKSYNWALRTLVFDIWYYNPFKIINFPFTGFFICIRHAYNLLILPVGRFNQMAHTIKLESFKAAFRDFMFLKESIKASPWIEALLALWIISVRTQECLFNVCMLILY